MVETPRAVVLVEGVSDQVAVETLAERRGRDLEAEGIAVVPIGGAQAIAHALDRFGPRGLDVGLAGLCDAAEEHDFRRALERVGLGSDLDRGGLEALGFYVCDADLEDELIRALGADAVLAVVEAHGDLGSFRTLQKQEARRWSSPTCRDRSNSCSGAYDEAVCSVTSSVAHTAVVPQVPRCETAYRDDKHDSTEPMAAREAPQADAGGDRAHELNRLSDEDRLCQRSHHRRSLARLRQIERGKARRGGLSRVPTCRLRGPTSWRKCRNPLARIPARARPLKPAAFAA